MTPANRTEVLKSRAQATDINDDSPHQEALMRWIRNIRLGLLPEATTGTVSKLGASSTRELARSGT
jgi:hypothetical protein